MLNLKGILVSAAAVLVLPTWALGQNGSASTPSTEAGSDGNIQFYPRLVRSGSRSHRGPGKNFQ